MDGPEYILRSSWRRTEEDELRCLGIGAQTSEDLKTRERMSFFEPSAIPSAV